MYIHLVEACFTTEPTFPPRDEYLKMRM